MDEKLDDKISRDGDMDKHDSEQSSESKGKRPEFRLDEDGNYVLE